MPPHTGEALSYPLLNLNESHIRNRDDSNDDVCRNTIACRGFRSSADDDQASDNSKDCLLYEAANVHG